MNCVLDVKTIVMLNGVMELEGLFLTNYELSRPLTALSQSILRVLPELQEAKNAKFSIMFSDTAGEHFGGRCILVEGSVRFRTGLDFTIIISRQEFDKLDDLGKIKLLIHELHHIGFELNKKGELRPGLRRHEGDYCEIPEHDKFSAVLAGHIKDRIKVPYFAQSDDGKKDDLKLVGKDGTVFWRSLTSDKVWEQELKKGGKIV